MQIKKLIGGVALVVGLVASSAVHAQGALAEEIWSASFCQEAVSLAKQHGESPEKLNQIDCQGMSSNYQPSEVIAKFQKAQDFISEAEDKNEVLLCKIR